MAASTGAGVPADCWACAWEVAGSLTAQGACMVAWLRGQHREHPGHGGPPDPETAVLASHLVRLNTLGVVTVNSQPGVGPVGPLPAAVGWSQRSYLDGYGPGPRVAGLVDSLAGEGFLAEAWPTRWEPLEPLEGREAVTCVDRSPVTFSTRRWGLADALAGLVQLRLSRDAMAALEGSWSFRLVDPVWGRPARLVERAAEVAGSWGPGHRPRR